MKEFALIPFKVPPTYQCCKQYGMALKWNRCGTRSLVALKLVRALTVHFTNHRQEKSSCLLRAIIKYYEFLENQTVYVVTLYSQTTLKLTCSRSHCLSFLLLSWKLLSTSFCFNMFVACFPDRSLQRLAIRTL